MNISIRNVCITENKKISVLALFSKAKCLLLNTVGKFSYFSFFFNSAASKFSVLNVMGSYIKKAFKSFEEVRQI